MARKHKHEDHENHERWLVSYADFITLLFAFFVVMYSISSVNEGKYRVLSESMVAAFRSSARSLEPIQVGNLARSPRNQMDTVLDAPRRASFKPIVIETLFPRDVPDETEETPPEHTQKLDINDNDWALDEAAQQVDKLADDVEKTMAPLIASDLVTVRRNRLWLEVELNTSYLFDSGSASPSIDAEVILLQLARVVKDQPNTIHVEGFTDNQPISSAAYPSNWELSSARAAAVVRLFAGYGVDPERMASIGYGEYRPVASNDTEMGRNKNRRVVVIIVANLKDDSPQASVTDFELLQQRLKDMTPPPLVN